jgi:hypothetical protein
MSFSVYFRKVGKTFKFLSTRWHLVKYVNNVWCKILWSSDQIRIDGVITPLLGYLNKDLLIFLDKFKDIPKRKGYWISTLQLDRWHMDLIIFIYIWNNYLKFSEICMWYRMSLNLTKITEEILKMPQYPKVMKVKYCCREKLWENNKLLGLIMNHELFATGT